MPLHKDLTGAELHPPGVHAAQHASAGSDPVSPAAIGALATTAGAVGTANLADGSVTAAKLASGVGGVTDHGALTGLTDDDHPQYHNDTRGDARYSGVNHTHAAADIMTGTMATARLGSGTANAAAVLRGDQTWGAPPNPPAFSWGLPGTVAAGTYVTLEQIVPYDMTLTGVALYSRAIIAGGAFDVDIQRSTDGGANFSTIFSTRPTVAAGARMGTTGTVFSTTDINQNDILRVDVVAANGAANATVQLRGRPR